MPNLSRSALLPSAAAALCLVGCGDKPDTQAASDTSTMTEYQAYVSRSRLSNVIATTLTLQMLTIEHYDRHGTLPPKTEVAYWLSSEQETLGTRVQMDDAGNIVIDLHAHGDAALRGHQLALIPHRTTNGKLVYVCGRASPPVGAQPLPGALHASTTDLPEAALPNNCRS